MSLGFENVDKKNVYEKKWKKGRNEEAPPCVSILACLTFITENTLGYYYVSLWQRRVKTLRGHDGNVLLALSLSLANERTNNEIREE